MPSLKIYPPSRLPDNDVTETQFNMWKEELEVYLSGSNIPAQQGSEAFGAKLGVLRISENETENPNRT